jgi:type I site-specific restriction endonuclease
MAKNNEQAETQLLNIISGMNAEDDVKKLQAETAEKRDALMEEQKKTELWLGSIAEGQEMVDEQKKKVIEDFAKLEKLVKSLKDNIAVADKLDIRVGVSQQAKDAANEWQKSFIEALHKAAKKDVTMTKQELAHDNVCMREHIFFDLVLLAFCGVSGSVYGFLYIVTKVHDNGFTYSWIGLLLVTLTIQGLIHYFYDFRNRDDR